MQLHSSCCRSGISYRLLLNGKRGDPVPSIMAAVGRPTHPMSPMLLEDSR